MRPRQPLTSAFLLVFAGVSGACPVGPKTPPDAGEGEGEGEGEIQVINTVFERDGVPLESFLLDLGVHDATSGPLLANLAVRNRGDEPFEILSEPPILVAGLDADSFSIPSQVGDPVIEPGAAAEFTLSYQPASGGSHSGSLVFAYGVQTEERVLLQLRAESGGVVDENGVGYAVYDGTFSLVPDFDALTAVETGVVPTFEITPRAPNANVGDQFAFRFDAELEVPMAGDYTFYVTSDDGSLLWIDGDVVVDNNGLHAIVTAPGTATLTEGRHAIRVGYFEGTGEAILQVEWEGPGVARAAIPASALFH